MAVANRDTAMNSDIVTVRSELPTPMDPRAARCLKNPLLGQRVKPVALYPDRILEFPREHNKAEHPEHFPESLFNSSATGSWLHYFLKTPPDVKAGLGIGGLSSRPDTAEKTTLKLAQWKSLYLNWHTAAPSHPGRGEAAWKKFL